MLKRPLERSLGRLLACAGSHVVIWSLVLVATQAGCATGDVSAPAETLQAVTGGTITVGDFERAANATIQKAGVAGLAVAIVNDRQIVYTRQFGWKDKDAGTRPDNATVFSAGSLGKTIFAYLTLGLADDGLIDLDRPLEGYMPRPLSTYPRYADLAADQRAHALTARMVLSHTTGLPNLRSNTPDGRLRLMFQPGSRFGYSGEGFQLLQFVVENVTKSDLETLAHDRVFVPVRMAHSSYVWRDTFAGNAAAPHNEFGWAGAPDRPQSADAAGSLLTTAEDYARFLVHVLAADTSQQTAVKAMFTPAVAIQSSRMFGATGPLSSVDAGKHLAWTLGWGTFDTPDGKAVFHTGHKTGAQSYTVAFLDRGDAIVLLSNSDNFESVASEIVEAGLGDRNSPFEWLGYRSSSSRDARSRSRS